MGLSDGSLRGVAGGWTGRVPAGVAGLAVAGVPGVSGLAGAGVGAPSPGLGGAAVPAPALGWGDLTSPDAAAAPALAAATPAGCLASAATFSLLSAATCSS